MYILYESYKDEYVNNLGMQVNTKILGIFKDKELAISEYNTHIDNTITKIDGEYDWFTQDIDLEILDNKNIIKGCYVFNGGIEVCDNNYVVILEKVEVKEND